jgi:sugar/nucleoside kinase (ribokinase family)
MPRLLAVGHVTWDELDGPDVLGGAVSYATLAAVKLGWQAAAVTSAGSDFVATRDLPGVDVFVSRASRTTRFRNAYDDDGARTQSLVSRADDIDVSIVPDRWREPDALLLAPVAWEVPEGAARAFQAEVVGAIAQGWVRRVDRTGRVSPRSWENPEACLAGVHVLFLSETDVPEVDERGRELLRIVPIVLVTRGWRGVTLMSREGLHDVPALPRPERDPTGAGDVFAAAFLVRYHETGDPLEAAAFASCAASCVVEGVGTSAICDRGEVVRRIDERRRLLEEGEWDET